MNNNQDMILLFYRVAHVINSSLDLDTTLQAILRAVQEALNAKAVVIRLLNPNADALDVAASVGVSQAFLARVPARVEPGNIHQRVLAGERVHISGLGQMDLTGAEPHDLPTDLLASEQIDQMLAVPLQVRGRAIGSLGLYCTAGCQFDEPTLALVQAIAELAARGSAPTPDLTAGPNCAGVVGLHADEDRVIQVLDLHRHVAVGRARNA